MLGAIGARFGENVSYYILTAVLLVYVVAHHETVEVACVLGAVLIGAVELFATIPVWGALSDRVGRRPVTSSARSAWPSGRSRSSRWSTPVVFALIALAVVVGLLFHGAMYGPQAAFFSELFDTRSAIPACRSATSWPRSSPAGWPR